MSDDCHEKIKHVDFKVETLKESHDKDVKRIDAHLDKKVGEKAFEPYRWFTYLLLAGLAVGLFKQIIDIT